MGLMEIVGLSNTIVQMWKYHVIIMSHLSSAWSVSWYSPNAKGFKKKVHSTCSLSKDIKAQRGSGWKCCQLFSNSGWSVSDLTSETEGQYFVELRSPCSGDKVIRCWDESFDFMLSSRTLCRCGPVRDQTEISPCKSADLLLNIWRVDALMFSQRLTWHKKTEPVWFIIYITLKV